MSVVTDAFQCKADDGGGHARTAGRNDRLFHIDICGINMRVVQKKMIWLLFDIQFA